MIIEEVRSDSNLEDEVKFILNFITFAMKFDDKHKSKRLRSK